MRWLDWLHNVKVMIEARIILLIGLKRSVLLRVSVWGTSPHESWLGGVHVINSCRLLFILSCVLISRSTLTLLLAQVSILNRIHTWLIIFACILLHYSDLILGATLRKPLFFNALVRPTNRYLLYFQSISIQAYDQYENVISDKITFLFSTIEFCTYVHKKWNHTWEDCLKVILQESVSEGQFILHIIRNFTVCHLAWYRDGKM